MGENVQKQAVFRALEFYLWKLNQLLDIVECDYGVLQILLVPPVGNSSYWVPWWRRKFLAICLRVEAA